jgi:hypothetical protein
MLLPCEIVAKSIIPAIKATIATRLTENHRMKQNEVAKLLGITQSAVSKYTTGTRGYILKIDEIDEVRPLITEITTILIAGADRRELLSKFCRTCTIIRKKGLMCKFCEKADQKMLIEECDFCLNHSMDEHI